MPISAIADDFPKYSPEAVVETYANFDGGPRGPLLKYEEERLLVYMSWKTPHGFVPMTLVCDTCAPLGLYLNRAAMRALKGYLLTNEDGCTMSARVALRDDSFVTVAVAATPTQHEPANLMGLGMLKRVGLVVHRNEPSFSLPVLWFDCFCSIE